MSGPDILPIIESDAEVVLRIDRNIVPQPVPVIEG